MKKIIAIAIIGTGLIWGCQEKAETGSMPQSEMNHDMNHEMDHDHGSMGKDSAGKMDQGHMNQSENVAYYTCPMESHKHIHSSEPGSCPECGMALVAAVEVSPDQADYFGCPVPSHSHIRADEAGKCPECNMNLKPFALKTP